MISGEAAAIAAYRRQVGWEGALLADLWVKHAEPLAPPPLAAAARDLMARSGADGIIVSGARTGEPPDPAFVGEVRGAVGDFPLWLGSGLGPDNAAVLWPLCDGAIVGTAFKKDGVVTAPVDEARVAALRRLLDRAS